MRTNIIQGKDIDTNNVGAAFVVQKGKAAYFDGFDISGLHDPLDEYVSFVFNDSFSGATLCLHVLFEDDVFIIMRTASYEFSPRTRKNYVLALTPTGRLVFSLKKSLASCYRL